MKDDKKAFNEFIRNNWIAISAAVVVVLLALIISLVV